MSILFSHWHIYLKWNNKYDYLRLMTAVPRIENAFVHTLRRYENGHEKKPVFEMYAHTGK